MLNCMRQHQSSENREKHVIFGYKYFNPWMIKLNIGLSSLIMTLKLTHGKCLEIIQQTKELQQWIKEKL